jgi:hypothetical protein
VIYCGRKKHAFENTREQKWKQKSHRTKEHIALQKWSGMGMIQNDPNISFLITEGLYGICTNGPQFSVRVPKNTRTKGGDVDKNTMLSQKMVEVASDCKEKPSRIGLTPKHTGQMLMVQLLIKVC